MLFYAKRKWQKIYFQFFIKNLRTRIRGTFLSTTGGLQIALLDVGCAIESCVLQMQLIIVKICYSSHVINQERL